MIDAIEDERGYVAADRQFEGWPVVASAWALVVLLLVLLAGVSAVACTSGMQPERHLAGAVIPQHDPCVGPGIPSAQGADGCKTVPLAKNWASYSDYW